MATDPAQPEPLRTVDWLERFHSDERLIGHIKGLDAPDQQAAIDALIAARAESQKTGTPIASLLGAADNAALVDALQEIAGLRKTVDRLMWRNKVVALLKNYRALGTYTKKYWPEIATSAAYAGAEGLTDVSSWFVLTMGGFSGFFAGVVWRRAKNDFSARTTIFGLANLGACAFGLYQGYELFSDQVAVYPTIERMIATNDYSPKTTITKNFLTSGQTATTIEGKRYLMTRRSEDTSNPANATQDSFECLQFWKTVRTVVNGRITPPISDRTQTPIYQSPDCALRDMVPRKGYTLVPGK